MQKTVALHGTPVTYTLRTSRRARRVRLVVRRDGQVILTVPAGSRVSTAERFLREKSRWLVAKIAEFKDREGQPIMRYTRADYLKHKEAARALVAERLAHFNTQYGFTFHRIAIKDQKTRWGSCSKKGNLNFNYKIVFLAPHLADYIIVHELCHLKELNHSRRFWQLVERALPEHRRLRRELKTIGLSLD